MQEWRSFQPDKCNVQHYNLKLHSRNNQENLCVDATTLIASCR